MKIQKIMALVLSAVVITAFPTGCAEKREYLPELMAEDVEVRIGESQKIVSQISAYYEIEGDCYTIDDADEKGKEELAAKAKEFQEKGKLSYESEEIQIAAVDETGIVTGNAVGTTTISVTLTIPSEDGEDEIQPVVTTVKVTVSPIMPEKVTADKDKIELTEGETADIQTVVVPEDTTDPSVNWTSSDEKIAAVKDGKITAVKAGTATITAASHADDSVKTEITVTVKEKPVQVSSSNAAFSSSGSKNSGSGKSSSGGKKATGKKSSQKSSGGKGWKDNGDGSYTFEGEVIDHGFIGGSIGDVWYDSEEEYNAALKEHGLS